MSDFVNYVAHKIPKKYKIAADTAPTGEIYDHEQSEDEDM